MLVVSFGIAAAVPAAAGPPGCLGRRATIVGTDGNDVVQGTQRPDVIVGLGGEDVIRARGGNDLACGDGDNDRIFAGAGHDSAAGGTGPEDLLFGGRGVDRLDGGRGIVDRLDGGPGDDYLDGGGGFEDHAMYESTRNDIVANLGTGVIRGVGRDLVANIEAVHGGAGNDVLIGNGQENDLDGFGGRDLIRGGGGDDFFLSGSGRADRVFGGPGHDHVLGGNGPDKLRGGPGDEDFIQPGLGNDSVTGGRGFDLLVYTFTTFPEVAPSVVVDLASGIAKGQGTDSLASIEEVWGSDGGDDVLLGNEAPENGLLGFGGDDVLRGRGGQDFLLPGRGDDRVAGGTNGPDAPDLVIYDFVSPFEEPENGVAVDLQAGTATGFGLDELTAVEGAIGTFHPDDLAGDKFGNLLVGLGDSDSISGREGDDLLDGDAVLLDGEEFPGTDTLDGGPDSDVCLGGEVTVNCESEMLAASARPALASLTLADMRSVRIVGNPFADHEGRVR